MVALAQFEPDIRPAPQTAMRASTAGSVLIWLGCGLLLAVVTWYRCVALDRLPGINGDEAWSGVQAVRIVRGEPIAWRTPTGNPINVFYLGPLAALHALLEPSFVLLRLVAVVSGVAALIINYLLCARVFGRTTAVVSTMILAVLPINIAYSRFGWDASQSLLFTLPVVYLPLLAMTRPNGSRKYVVLSGICLTAAILVHPTNLFIAPVVILPVLFRDGRWHAFIARHWSAVQYATAAAVAITWSVSECIAPGSAIDFVRRLIALFSGRTMYDFISGSTLREAAGSVRAPLLIIELATCVLVAGGLANVFWSVSERRAIYARMLGGALLISLIAFAMFAGPIALTPGYERYALWLVAPVTVLVSGGLAGWLDRDHSLTNVRALILIAVGWLFALSFAENYLCFLSQTGGRAHRTFRTANVEPKAQALEVVRAASPGVPAWIVTEEWWLYWPLQYLSSGDARLHVVMLPLAAEATGAGPNKHANVFVLSFAKGDVSQCDAKSMQQQSGTLHKCIYDASGQPLILVSQTANESSEKD